MSDKMILTDAQVRERLGNKSQKTIDRWAADPTMGFPQPIYIRGRKHRDVAALEEFEARLAATAGQVPTDREYPIARKLKTEAA